MLMALWWSWACYSWLTDVVAVHSITELRLIIFSASAAIAVAALALPDAFGDAAALFASAYFAARLLHVGLFLKASRDRPASRRAIRKLAPGLLGGPALLVIGSLLDGPARAVLWIAALALDYLTPLWRDPEGLDIHPRHFAERHGLVIILALGESVASIGASHPAMTASAVIVAVLAIVLCAALWWSYFDFVKASAQKRLEEAGNAERSRLARDAYSYLHLAMVGGIIFIAVGVKQTIADPEQALALIAASTMCGGAALYLLGLFVFRLRVTGTVRLARLIAAVLACAVIPIALVVPAIFTVAIISSVLVGLVTFETLVPDRFRAEVKHGEG
jgi:low temperature requirement protein LtrA